MYVVTTLPTGSPSLRGNSRIRNVWKILNCPQNVLEYNKIVHPTQVTCVVVISCVSRAFGDNQFFALHLKSQLDCPPNALKTQEIVFQYIWGTEFKISHTFLYMTVSHSLGNLCIAMHYMYVQL